MPLEKITHDRVRLEILLALIHAGHVRGSQVPEHLPPLVDKLAAIGPGYELVEELPGDDA